MICVSVHVENDVQPLLEIQEWQIPHIVTTKEIVLNPIALLSRTSYQWCI